MNKVYVDKARLLRRVIVISWATLALCFVVKIFGGNFFEIMCESENYKALCEYAEKHLWFDFVLSNSISLFCQSFYLLAIIQKYKFSIKEFIFTFISVIVCWFIRIYLFEISFICDLWLLIIMPIILLGKNYKKYWQIIFAVLFNLVFQFVSLIVKNLSIGYIDDSIFLVLIYGIDVYIMCFLYYLYRNFIKENNDMGRFWTLFMGKPVDRLKKMKAKREEKISKLEKEIADIELIIERKKNEE
jgi:hypothetical protein